VKLDDEDIAMDFFRGLDNGRYSSFKTEIMNLLTTKTLPQPKDLNAMFLLANQWLKPNTRSSSGTATTFATSVSTIHRSRGGNRNKSNQNRDKRNNGRQNSEERDQNSSEEKTGREKDHIECYFCGERGHYANKCPKRGSQDNENSERKHSHVTWNASTFTSYYIYASGGSAEKFGPHEVLLDNQSDISVMRPDLLLDIQSAERPVSVVGAGGIQFTAHDTGYLQDFFNVYSSKDTHANILSLAEVEDLYPVTYVPRTSFTVHLPDRDIAFYRRGKHYIADWNQVIGHVYASNKVYTKSEENRAKLVYEFLKKSGYPSMEEAIHLIEDGNIFGMPSLTRDDVKRAYEIYGLAPEYVRGKMTKQVVSRVSIDDNLVLDEKRQKLYTDVMHIDGNKFLITVCEPLQLTLQCRIERELQNELGIALQGQLELLRSHSFVPTIVYVDPQSAFKSMTTMFPGVILDVGGAKDHVCKVDAKIRRIKELYRSVKSGLPWQLPNVMVRDLVAYSVSRINIRRTTAINQNVCPRVLFTGIKVNYKKELELAFGDYVEVYDGTDNTSKARSVPCIALFPCANSTGSWEFMNLISKRRIRRSHWKLMKTSRLIVNTMNSFESGGPADDNFDLVEENVENEEPTESSSDYPTAAEQQMPEELQSEVIEQQEETNITDEGNSVEVMAENANTVGDNINASSVENSTGSDSTTEEHEVVDVEVAVEPIPRRSERVAKGINPPSRYAMAVKVLKSEVFTEDRLKAIEDAEAQEILLLFSDLQALLPVYKKHIKGMEALNCHMFTVEKFKANGEFDKMKSRLVANGNEQDPEIYYDRSSPTVAIHSIFTSLLVAAVNISYKIAKIDVKGAFVQTKMKGTDVYIKCRPSLTKQIIKVLPGLKKYVAVDGMLYCKLLKALYGCVQASKLWYDNLVEVLEKEGYERCPTDPCVLRKIVDEKVYLLLVYVDDILVIAEEDEIEHLRKVFVKEFQWITMDVGTSHSYLGMHITAKEGKVSVDMSFYIDKILEDYKSIVIDENTSPGHQTTFVLNDDSPELDSKSQKKFHSTVAKLLYLSKRARPDILTVVSFLCTRVQKPTEEDYKKLLYLLGYLKSTKHIILILRPNKVLIIEAYIDASFALHYDGKSHTGIAIFVGGVLVFAASRKQKCVTKSPTESEMVALTDNISFVELFEEFLSFILNIKQRIPTIYQDSTSVISLVTKGGGIMRTKHLRARMNLGLEAVNENRIMIVYRHTSQMIADGLSKPLVGESFMTFRNAILGLADNAG
jgi:hypothetical protein